MDIRQLALEAALESKPFWVEKWKCWILVRELTGDAHAWLLDKALIIEQKGGKTKTRVDHKKYYPLLAILSARNPDPEIVPEHDDPHYALYPGATDEQGNYLTSPHPKPGELIFTVEDMGPLNKRSAAVLDAIGTFASKMSGMRVEDIDEKKESSEEDLGEPPSTE